jgi:hypothetical protein
MKSHALIGGVALLAAACSSGREQASHVRPVYNQESGKLEQLVSDRDRDGRAETRAFMSGTAIERVEIDRNGDGAPDRWEYYAKPSGAGAAPIVERVEEANGSDKRITRREFYAGGTIQRVEDDTNGDGRIDKWESYEAGQLARVELDLVGKGFPSQRLVYGPAGDVVRVETDPDGDGQFVPVSSR